MNRPDLSVVIPSYNETARLKLQAIDQIDQFLKKQKYSYEVLIVDDKSTNGTVNEVEKAIKNKKGFKLIKNEHGGKAITVMTGMLKASGAIVLFTDMDQATPISEANKIMTKMNQGFDVVIGQRGERKGAPITRKVVSLGFQICRNLIVGLPFKDTQCGFKAFTNQAAQEVFPQMLARWQEMKSSGAAVNAGFDVEALFIAKQKGLKIAAIDVEWRHVDNEKQVKIVHEAIEALTGMLKIRLNSLQGKLS